jgi:hypothetical protein
VATTASAGTARHAAWCGSDVPLKCLLEQQQIDIDPQDSEGDTPLLTAIRLKRISKIKLLLKNNADINLANHSYETPLIAAVRSNDSKIFPLILQKADDIMITDSDRNTPLHYAVMGNNQDFVSKLLARGANPLAKNRHGRSPFSMATSDTLAPLRDAVQRLQASNNEKKAQSLAVDDDDADEYSDAAEDQAPQDATEVSLDASGEGAAERFTKQELRQFAEFKEEVAAEIREITALIASETALLLKHVERARVDFLARSK